jgi:hypothetical protein
MITFEKSLGKKINSLIVIHHCCITITYYHTEYVRHSDIIPHNGPWKTALFASLISGIFVTISMAPFDLVVR